MKKVVVAAVVVVVIFGFIRMKMVERDRNFTLAEDYFIEVCGKDQGCADRLIRFRPCFAGAYRRSPAPNGDWVDVDSLVSCLNGKYPVPKLDAARSSEMPFPRGK